MAGTMLQHNKMRHVMVPPQVASEGYARAPRIPHARAHRAQPHLAVADTLRGCRPSWRRDARVIEPQDRPAPRCLPATPLTHPTARRSRNTLIRMGLIRLRARPRGVRPSPRQRFLTAHRLPLRDHSQQTHS